jgi:hypothetical protein
MYSIQQPAVPLDHVEALRDGIQDLFVTTDTTLDFPQPGYIRFRGHFVCDLDECYDELRRRFEAFGYTPLIRKAEPGAGVALVALPTIFDPPDSRWAINLILFLLVIPSTLFAGALSEPEFAAILTQEGFSITGVLANLWRGWPFSLSILLILGAHELGHYFAARYHNVPVTLPYFIPFPSIIGTMGAFIRLKAPIKNRRALLDIGAAGPLAGMVFAIPILFIGLYTSDLVAATGSLGLREGNSILYGLSKVLVFGEWLPSSEVDVGLNQVAWAGWVGLFVTGLNLIPVGQLDGGHISYVLFGERARRFFWPAIIALIALSLLTGVTTWWIWVALLFVFGRAYAQPLDDVTPLDPRRRAIAIFSLILFFLVFVPVPLQTIGG